MISPTYVCTWIGKMARFGIKGVGKFITQQDLKRNYMKAKLDLPRRQGWST